jgi:sugar-specific transcriptional regulator TrmB
MFEEFGLTFTEEKVYLALIRLGESGSADIIKNTQLHRTTVYDVLNRLIEKGIVGYILKNNQKYYSCSSPSKFIDIAIEEKVKAEKKQILAKDLVKKVNLIKKNSKSENLAQIFVGDKGQKTIMNDIINVGKDFMIFGSEGSAKESLPAYTEQWANLRRIKNIHAKIIATEGTNAPVWKMNQIKFLQKEYHSPASTIIYGDKVAFFIPEEPVLIILIQSKKLSQSYKSYFNLLWKVAK